MDYDKLPDIPKEFFNSETNRPFSNCLVCECNLMEESQPYAIERAIRHYPEMELKSVVFEYALCANCIAQMENELSSDTKLAIMTYFSENLDFNGRPQWKPQSEDDEEEEPSPFNISEWIDNCSVKGVPKSELYEYTLCARCIGGKIIPEVVPYMISGLAQDDIVELFSNKSLGFLDDFTDKHFSGPPELKELFKGRPILV
ncbi:MAG: hypothetical protein ACPGU4_04275 [Flavobacteriales bacterium]